ncbi:MAG TPA: ribosome silencing factor [Limnochordia bacterium]
MTAEEIAIAAAQAAVGKRANDVIVLKLRGLTIVTDFFVIASAEAAVQVRAVVEAIQERLHALGRRCLSREGWEDARWVLLDYGDVVVHVFRQPDREYYELERLWGDAERIDVPAVAEGLPQRSP